MSVQNATIKDAPTGFTITGGTDKTFKIDGQSIPDGIRIVDVSQADPRLRRSFIIRCKPAKKQANGTWSLERRYITSYTPILEADGSVSINIQKYESSRVATTSAATEAAMRFNFVQLLFDTDFEEFHTIGTLQ